MEATDGAAGASNR